jgi:large repetitive protein
MRRFVLILVVAIGLAGVVVPSAAALRFESGDCYESSPGGTWVCPTGTVGSGYSAQLKGAGGCGPALPYQYRVLSGALPPGISLSASGAFGGTPTTAGTYDFWVELSDQDPPSASWCAPAKSQRPFRITINPGAGSPPPPPLVIETSSAPTGTVGVSYSTALKATPSGSQTWKVTGGALPPGLGLAASTGLVSGTPAAAGSFGFQVTVTDTASRSAERDLQIAVRAPLVVTPLAPQGSQGGLPFSEVGIPLDARVTATGGSPQLTWALAAGALPDGVVLQTDGTLVGAPRTAGRFTFTVRVSDDEGRTATLDATLTVAPTLSITTRRLRSATAGRPYRAKIGTLGGVGPVTWTIVRGTPPRGVRLARKLGLLVGTPRRVPVVGSARTRTYRFTLEATDALGVQSRRTLTLVVRSAKR